MYLKRDGFGFWRKDVGEFRGNLKDPEMMRLFGSGSFDAVNA